MRARLMTAIVVALVTLFGALAAAAATVEFIGGVADGRGSLVIKSPRVLPFASDQVGRGLILAFDDQVRGDPAAAGAALAGFVDKIKLEDGGATVIVTLTADRRARVRRAGTDIVVEISAGDAGAGKPVAATPTIPARVGRHKSYDRVVFDWPRKVAYSVEVADCRARVTFQAPGRIDVTVLARRLPADLSVTAIAGARPGLRFDLPAGVTARAARLGPKIIVDFKRSRLPSNPRQKPPKPPRPRKPLPSQRRRPPRGRWCRRVSRPTPTRLICCRCL